MQWAKGKKGTAQEESSLLFQSHAPSRSWKQADEVERTGEAGSGDYEEEDGYEQEDGYGEEEDDESAEGSSFQVLQLCHEPS